MWNRGELVMLRRDFLVLHLRGFKSAKKSKSSLNGLSKLGAWAVLITTVSRDRSILNLSKGIPEPVLQETAIVFAAQFVVDLAAGGG
jgi:hypothetical protein